MSEVKSFRFIGWHVTALMFSCLGLVACNRDSTPSTQELDPDSDLAALASLPGFEWTPTASVYAFGPNRHLMASQPDGPGIILRAFRKDGTASAFIGVADVIGTGDVNNYEIHFILPNDAFVIIGIREGPDGSALPYFISDGIYYIDEDADGIWDIMKKDGQRYGREHDRWIPVNPGEGIKDLPFIPNEVD